MKSPRWALAALAALTVPHGPDQPPAVVRADFMYPDFNDTQGLVFNGAAGTTSCSEFEPNEYGDVQNDADEYKGTQPVYSSETVNLYSERTVITNERHVTPADVATPDGGTAVFRNRDKFVSHPDTRCPVRVRLNPSQPSRVGSTWYHAPLPVNKGFQTMFTYQVSDHSKECSKHRDPTFSLALYESCAVHGGDGFAFVLHRDTNETAALGGAGRGLGYDGLENSLAIEFDTWYNPDSNFTATGVDLLVDHVAVHSRSTGANSALESASLGQQRPTPIGDGTVHLVKVQYLPYIALQYLANFTATPAILPYLKDNTEGRRIGTLLVFVDDGVAKDVPILAIPINLSLLLQLPQDRAYAGFTAATGNFWEKHDILSWLWCDTEDCSGNKKDVEAFDYHQSSFYSAAFHKRATPGSGYGGTSSMNEPGVEQDNKAPTRNQNPPTDPLYASKTHFTRGRNEGLLDDAAKQVPPNTQMR